MRFKISLFVLMVCLMFSFTSVYAGGKIKLGGMFDITGPTGDVGKLYAQAVRDYMRYINEEKGGINGKKIELVDTDYQYKIPQAIAFYKLLKTRYRVIGILGWGTGDTEALAPMVAKDKIPYISASYTEHVTNPKKFPYNFIAATSYSDQARIACEFIKQDWKHWNERPPKVCFMYSDTGFGRSPVADAKAYAKKLGFQIAKDQIVDLRALDATSQILNVKKEGVDYIIYQNTIMSSATVAKDRKRLGCKAKMICLNWAIGEKWLQLVGNAGEGVYGVIPYALWTDTNLPGVQLAHKIRKKYHPEAKGGSCRYIQGLIAAMLMEEAIHQAGDDLTGPGIKAGFERIKNFDMGGLLPPVTYSAKSHKPCRAARIYQVQHGKLVPITGYISVKE